ncbi:hypothetical protein GQ457_12G010220 [Hibiscus cannabinus]
MANQEIEFADKKLEIINRNEDEDNDNSDSDNDDLIGDDKTINNSISEEVWDIIGKELKDFDESDMKMLKWASIEECIEFCYTYAKVKGFGVRKGTSVKSRTDGRLILKILVCHKQGVRCEKWNNLPTRRRVAKPISRVGCLARIQFKYHEQYKIWKVQKFHANIIMKWSFRKISDTDQVKISNMHNSGIAPNRMMRSFVNEAGSLENVGFIQKDLYNFVDKIKVLEQLIAAEDGYKPLTVITDRDKAMANAISKVLPEAKHRLWLWHLLRNVKLYDNIKFREGFMKCVDKCRSQTDFEKAWKELICKHDCQDKKWAKDLYEDKEKWA